MVEDKQNFWTKAISDGLDQGMVDLVGVLVEIRDHMAVLGPKLDSLATMPPLVPTSRGGRPNKASTTAPAAVLAPPKELFGKGDTVTGLFSDGGWYLGVVKKVHKGDYRYTVEFEDGDVAEKYPEGYLADPDDADRMALIEAKKIPEVPPVTPLSAAVGSTTATAGKRRGPKPSNLSPEQRIEARAAKRATLLGGIPYDKPGLEALKRQELVMLAAAIGVKETTQSRGPLITTILRAQRKGKYHKAVREKVAA